MLPKVSDPNTFGRVRLRLRKLARDIEDLAPAVQRTDSNCEYPWESGGALYIPADFAFNEIIRDLQSVNGVRMIRVIEAMFEHTGPSRAA